MTLVYLIFGFVALVAGADFLVRGASRLASLSGISPLVIGLTIVAFGTSAPEAAVSVTAALGGHVDISLGNVVGSNIFNILVVLGLSALFTPILIAMQLLKFETPLMLGLSLMLVFLAKNGTLTPLEGILFLLGIIFYTVWSIRKSRKESKKVQEEFQEAFSTKGPGWHPWLMNSLWILSGLALLVYGSKWLVTAASHVAKALGVSDMVIGLTIVAAGTSLPELATSIVAACKKEGDIAAGNVVGSNIFNILFILGLASTISGKGLHFDFSAVQFDLWIMAGAAALCLPFFLSGFRVNRWEGLTFLLIYGFYLTYLIMAAKNDPRVSQMKLGTTVLIAFSFLISWVIFLVQKLTSQKKRSGNTAPSS